MVDLSDLFVGNQNESDILAFPGDFLEVASGSEPEEVTAGRSKGGCFAPSGGSILP